MHPQALCDSGALWVTSCGASWGEICARESRARWWLLDFKNVFEMFSFKELEGVEVNLVISSLNMIGWGFWLWINGPYCCTLNCFRGVTKRMRQIKMLLERRWLIQIQIQTRKNMIINRRRKGSQIRKKRLFSSEKFHCFPLDFSAPMIEYII